MERSTSNLVLPCRNCVTLAELWAANRGRSRLFSRLVAQFLRNSPARRHNPQLRHYNRRLPHWDTLEQPLFVTFRLRGSLPVHRVFPPDALALSGKAFVAMDRLLDRSVNGPVHLRRQEIAELVVQALQDGQHKFLRYELHAFVIMLNHVHLLVTPKVVASRWLAPLKGFTAHRANEFTRQPRPKPVGRTSYDHLVRSSAEPGEGRIGRRRPGVSVVERDKPPEGRLRSGLTTPHY